MKEKIFEEPEMNALEHKWSRCRKLGVDFESFEAFCKWAKQSGYTYGRTIKRKDITKPYSPENSFWYEATEVCMTKYEKEFIPRWNQTVNRIRAHYGMELIEVE